VMAELVETTPLRRVFCVFKKGGFSKKDRG